MATAVYSVRFALVQLTDDDDHVLYTVGDGDVAILRDVDFFQSSIALADVYLLLSGIAFAHFAPPGAGSQNSGSWRGRLVLNVGDTLEASVPGFASGEVNIAASGYLLTAA